MSEILTPEHPEQPRQPGHDDPAPSHWSRREPRDGAVLSLSEYGEGIGNATSVIRNNLAAAGLDAPVPTCPGWTGRDLLEHVGVAQRWCTAVLSGIADRPDETALRADLGDFADPLDWFDEGAVEMLNAIVRAPADGEFFFFLKNAPASKRDAWARRQCHETTIHGVDAMAARLGSLPSADQVWFKAPPALDGLDELLRGFVPRRSTPLRPETPRIMAVVPDDAEVPNGGWTVAFGPEGATTEHGVSPDAEATLTGSAVALYLGLWNRGSEYEVSGDPEVVQTFSDLMKVQWLA